MPPALLARATTNTSSTDSTMSGSSGNSGGGKAKVSRSTGRGGAGNMKRTVDEASGSALTRDQAAVIGGREAPVVASSSSKRLNTGRGGSGNIRARVYTKSSKTAALITQYENPIRSYEQDLINASASKRQRNVGASGRGGAGNNYLGKVKSPTSSTSSAWLSSSSSSARATDSPTLPEGEFSRSGLNPRYQPRKISVPRELMSRLKLGKGKKKKKKADPLPIDPSATSLSSSTDLAPVVDIRPPSSIHSSSATPSTSSVSERESVFFSETSTFAQETLDSDDVSPAQKRSAIVLPGEPEDEEDDDESIYLAYAREDNSGDYDDIDTIVEESEDALSDVEEGASICIHAVGLEHDDVDTESEPSTPRPLLLDVPHPSFHTPFGYPSPVTPQSSAYMEDEDEDDVDPSLRVMRARYSMARHYGSSPTPSYHSQASHLRTQSPSAITVPSRQPPSSLPSGNSYSSYGPGTPRTLSSPFGQHADTNINSMSSTRTRMEGLISALELTLSPPPSLSELPTPHGSPITATRSLSHTHVVHPSPNPSATTGRQSPSRISLLSATDLAANDDLGDEALPPYTPKATTGFGTPPVRSRPLPSVPEGSAVERLLNLPSVPLDAPRGPRRPPRLISRQYTPAERDSVAETIELAGHIAWPSPPLSPPHHRALRVTQTTQQHTNQIGSFMEI